MSGESGAPARGLVVVPEVREAVIELPRRRRSPSHGYRATHRREGVADVVPADETDLGVDDEDLAVVLAGIAEIEGEEAGTDSRGSASP